MAEATMSDGIDRFHAHLDVCEQCREHPFNLCLVGASLLREAGTGQKEFMGMKYPFKECARPKLRPLGYHCQDCSVEMFCAAPDKEKAVEK